MLWMDNVLVELFRVIMLQERCLMEEFVMFVWISHALQVILNTLTVVIVLIDFVQILIILNVMYVGLIIVRKIMRKFI